MEIFNNLIFSILVKLDMMRPQQKRWGTPRCVDRFWARREIEERIDHFASGLEQEELTPRNGDDMKLLALYSKNRPEWVLAEQVRE